MKNLTKSFVLIGAIALVLFSCTDDYFEFDKIKTEEWRPELAVPLINSSLTLGDIIIREDSGGAINTNQDGVLEVIYESSVINTIGQRAYTVPIQTFTDTFSTPSPIPPFNGGIPLPFSQSIDLEFKDTSGFGVVIDSMTLKQGQLAFTIENEYPYQILLQAKFRTFTDNNGDTLVISYNIPAATSSTPVQVGSQVVDLTSYQLNMTEDANGDPAENVFPIDLDFIVQLENGVGSAPTDEVRVTGQLSGIDFKEFYGYLGNSVQELEKDTFAVQLFKNFTTSEFFLSNPFLNVTVFNSFSVPISFDFLYLDAINPKKAPNEVLSFRVPQSLKPLELQYPAKYGREITSVQLDRTNSNIDSVVSFLLERVAFDSKVQFNPDGVPPPGQPRNFISDTSDIGLDVQFRIPFEGRAAGFFIEDTIDFNFEVADDLDDGIVRVIAENGFPMEVSFQLFFLDSNLTVIDSLLTNGISSLVSPANVNSNGEVISESKLITDIDISGNRLQNLADGRKVAIVAQLNTTGALSGNNVKFRPEHRLGISVGLKAKILID